MTGPAVSVREASKRYRDVLALDRVSLEVRQGEVYALLGLNGAGKTTLIRLLLGMVRPTAGHVEIGGVPVGDRSTWRRVGYLVESPAAYPELTVRENLEVARRLRMLPDRRTVDEAIDLFGLRAYADRRARTLSSGNAQRLGLAKALLHRPSLAVLDEPVNGLDPAGVVEIRTLLLELAREHGMTVLLSSHVLAEVARVASRIGVLHEGRMVDEFDSQGLEARVSAHLEVRTIDDTRAAGVMREAGLSPRPTPTGLVLDDAASVRRPDAVARVLVQAGAAPTHLAVTEEDLETYFLRLVRTRTTGTAEVRRGQ